MGILGFLDEGGANTRRKGKFGACRVRQLVGEDCYAGALAAESSTARHLVLGLVRPAQGVRTMKYIIALATVVVSMTGLCRADEAATHRQAVLYEEDQATPNGTRFAGSVEWRTERPAPGTPRQPEVVLRAKIEIPEQKVQVRLSLRRNDNKQLPASHTFEIVFTLPQGFRHGGISNIPGLLMKQGETTRGVPLKGASVKVTTNFFLIGLSSVDADMQRNVQLLKEPGWLDIPIVYGDGKRAVLAVQKAPLTAAILSLLEPRHDSQHSAAVSPKLPDQIAPPALALPTKAPEYASQPAASAERRVALVIGNSEYSSAAFLPNPRRDAKAVADALREVGFQTVDLALNLDRDAMAKALRAFRDQADTADWALIYFAGHGIEMSGVNYLVPIDAKLFDDRDVKAETVSYEELLDAARGAKMLRLLVLDACRVNPFKDSMRRTIASRGSNDRGLAPPPEAEPGTLVVYSAKDGEVAADDVDGVNSPFARAFVAELKVPGLEVRRLFDYVRDDVLDATNKHQQPFTYGSLPGRRDFYFVAKR
jgi:hypothetical protein